MCVAYPLFLSPLIAKFTGGERTNLIQRSLYKTRCLGAGLSYNSGTSFHRFSTRQDKHFLYKFCAKRQNLKLYSNKSKWRKMKIVQQEDMDYGTNAAKPDLSSQEVELEKTNIMTEINNVNTSEPERKTVGQKENVEWHQARRNRLTASSFGKICLRRLTTPAHNLIKELFYRNTDLKTKAIQYGIDNEKIAINKFENLVNLEVHDCGLFVCPNFCFLGASPDGISDNNEVIEVKCLYSCKTKTIREAVTEKKTLCVEYVNGELCIKKLNICDKEYAYLYTDVDLQFIKIKKDRLFWDNVMLPKLTKFWEDCALPELADPRIPRGLKVHDN